MLDPLVRIKRLIVSGFLDRRAGPGSNIKRPEYFQKNQVQQSRQRKKRLSLRHSGPYLRRHTRLHKGENRTIRRSGEVLCPYLVKKVNHLSFPGNSNSVLRPAFHDHKKGENRAGRRDPHKRHTPLGLQRVRRGTFRCPRDVRHQTSKNGKNRRGLRMTGITR
jgi:hypothetical protein